MYLKYEFGDYGEFEFDVDFYNLKKALVEIMCKNLKQKHKDLYDDNGAHQMAMYVVYDLDIVDELSECFLEELQEYFYNDAKEEYEQACDNESELADWYGTKSDVLGV